MGDVYGKGRKTSFQTLCGGAGHCRLFRDGGRKYPRDALFSFGQAMALLSAGLQQPEGGAVALNGRLEHLPSGNSPGSLRRFLDAGFGLVRRRLSATKSGDSDVFPTDDGSNTASATQASRPARKAAATSSHSKSARDPALYKELPSRTPAPGPSTWPRNWHRSPSWG